MESISDTYNLSPREQLVLLQIIQQHVQTAQPVGSRTIAKQGELSLSPASIRNIMSDLEERGLIGHPHTSAGRVPTDMGYRCYIDSIMQSEALTEDERSMLELQFDPFVPGGLQDLVRESARVLSKISHLLAIVVAPSMDRGTLGRIELVRVASDKVMVILSVRDGIVRSLILQIRADVPSQQLDHIAAYLNERLAGLTLLEIRDSIPERMRDAASDDHELIRLFVHAGERLFSERGDGDALSIDGIHSLSQQPEFGDPREMRNLLAWAEDREVIVHVLDSLSGSQALTIRIGREMADDKLRNYSIIAAPYRVGTLNGTVSVLGPKRMNYPRMAAIVEHIARLIST
jgi:heat-inducible transcriptional repressor